MSNSLSIPSELNDSFNDLISSSSSTNWIMFTYDKGTNNLKLHSSGTKGLPELEEEFDQGKVQYAFARVIEEQSNLTKLAMISWCGDGAPSSKKGLYSFHVNEIQAHFKGIHVHINARQDADIEPLSIMKKVKDSAGTKYVSTKMNYPVDRVQSVNQNVNLVSSIQPNRNSQSIIMPSQLVQSDEKINYHDSKSSVKPIHQQIHLTANDHSLLRPVESVKSSIHAKLSKNDLSNQNTTRFTNSKTKSTNISNQYTGSTSFKGVDLINAEKFSRNELRQPSLSRKDIPPSSNELVNPIQYSNYSSQGIIKGKFSGTIEQQPKIYSVDLPDKSIGSMNATESGLQEEESFIRTSQVFVNEIRKLSLNEKTSELKDVTTITPKNINSIKTNEIQSSFPINLNKTLKSPVNTAFENNFAPSLIPLKRNDKTNLSKLENSTHGEKESLKDAYEVRKKQKELDRQTFSTLILSTPIKEKTEISKSAIVLYDYDAQDANELSLRENEIIDDIDEIDEGWWTGKNSRSVVGMFPANFVVLRRNDIIVPISSRSELENLDGTQDDQHQIIAVVQEYSTEMTKLFSATVLYDYISKDENEISLTEKENIVEIYAVDDGWWSGINSQGRRGLFPANFVEQSNQSKEGAVSSSMCAKVEYDYTARESNELTLIEGEIIKEIAMIDDGWWSGSNSRMQSGLFPANYVALLQ